jgi:putative MATE family efflux protein
LKQVDFENGSVARNVIETSLPMLCAQVLSLLYSIVDRIYIGRIAGVGTAALAGIGLCFPITVLILAFANLFGMGGAPLCAIARGQGDNARAERIMNTSFSLLAVTSIVLTVFGLVFSEPMLRVFGASDETIVYALPYLRICLLGSFASMITSGLNPFINAQGFAGMGMLTVFIGTIINVVLDPLFIFVFRMGVAGAAIATVFSQCVSAVFVLLFLFREKSELHLSVANIRNFKWSDAFSIMALGSVGFVMQTMNSLVAIVCNNVLFAYGGDLSVSTYTIVSSVRQMMETPVLAITEGASPVLSYNYGAHRYEKVRKAIRLITMLALAYTAIVWILIILFPSVFIGVFSSDESLLAAAVPALHLYFFAFIFQSLQYNGQTVFKALNKKRQAIFFSLFRKAVMVIPLTIFLPRLFKLGANGVFIAEPISNVIGGTAAFTTMMITVYYTMKRSESGDIKKID